MNSIAGIGHENEVRQTMATIIRRVLRLENRFCPAVDVELYQRLHDSLEAGRRRVAEARERGELEPDTLPPLDLPPGRHSRIEVLHAGRRRAALAYGRPGSEALE